MSTQPNSPVFQQVILNQETITLHPSGRFRVTLTLLNNTEKIITLCKNKTLDTITANKNVYFSFGFISEYDLQQYVCKLILNS
jgi:hypothetical protein